MRALGFVLDYGGRVQAGYKSSASDCVCRAVAIATGKPYPEVYAELVALGKAERASKRQGSKSHPRTGIRKPTTRKYLASLGWRWHPTMQIGSGTTVHLRADELPMGKLIVQVTGHVTAVIDHVIHDTHDPSRDGTRAVYGFWTAPDANPDHLAAWLAGAS